MSEQDRELLHQLHAAGVTFTVDGGRLTYRGPAGAITPEARAALATLKTDLLHDYNERAGIMEFDGGLSRPEAEAAALQEVFHGGPD